MKRPDLFETEKQLKEEQEDGQHRETVTVTLACRRCQGPAKRNGVDRRLG